MRKFVIQSVSSVTSIIEVEYEVMPKFYDYALKEGEWKGKITAPAFLYEKDVNNKLVPPVWCWWAFHESVDAAKEYLKTSFRDSIVRAREKKCRIAGVICYPLTSEELDDEVKHLLDKIKVVML